MGWLDVLSFLMTPTLEQFVAALNAEFIATGSEYPEEVFEAVVAHYGLKTTYMGKGASRTVEMVDIFENVVFKYVRNIWCDDNAKEVRFCKEQPHLLPHVAAVVAQTENMGIIVSELVVGVSLMNSMRERHTQNWIISEMTERLERWVEDLHNENVFYDRKAMKFKVVDYGHYDIFNQYVN